MMPLEAASSLSFFRPLGHGLDGTSLAPGPTTETLLAPAASGGEQVFSLPPPRQAHASGLRWGAGQSTAMVVIPPMVRRRAAPVRSEVRGRCEGRLRPADSVVSPETAKR
jgi:hypothetical protein